MLNGIAYSILAALLFGGVTVASKPLLSSAGPAVLGSLAYLGAGIVGILAWAFLRVPVPDHKDDGHAQTFCFLSALVLGAILAPLLLMTGLQTTSASFGSVLANIEGIATALLAWIVFRERARLLGILGVLVVLSGVVCFSMVEKPEISGGSGPLLVAAAYLFWAIDLNLMRRVQRYSPVAVTAIRGLSGATVMGIVAWLRGEALPDGATAAAAVAVGAFGFGLSFVLMLKALPLIGTARAGAIFAAAPVFGYLLSAFVDGAAMDVVRLAALGLVAGGILIAGLEVFADAGRPSGPPARRFRPRMPVFNRSLPAATD